MAAVSTSCSFCKENPVFYTKKASFVKKCKFSLHMVISMISICNYLNTGQCSPALAVTARRYNFVSVTRPVLTEVSGRRHRASRLPGTGIPPQAGPESYHVLAPDRPEAGAWSGFVLYYKAALGAGINAKTMTGL